MSAHASQVLECSMCKSQWGRHWDSAFDFVYAGRLGHVAWRCDQASKNVSDVMVSSDFLCWGVRVRMGYSM